MLLFKYFKIKWWQFHKYNTKLIWLSSHQRRTKCWWSTCNEKKRKTNGTAIIKLDLKKKLVLIQIKRNRRKFWKKKFQIGLVTVYTRIVYQNKDYTQSGIFNCSKCVRENTFDKNLHSKDSLKLTLHKEIHLIKYGSVILKDIELCLK